MAGDPVIDTHWLGHNLLAPANWPVYKDKETEVAGGVQIIETEEEKRKRLFKEKVESLSQADLLQELLIASNTARKTRDMEKYRVNRKRKNKAAARSRARNR